jgi:enediyne biosynthesis protein E4
VGVAIGNFANEMTALYVATRPILQFKDDAVSNGLGPQTRLELTFGLFFADIDLDGRPDLLATNGHLEEDIHKVQSSQRYKQPAHFFWNCGAENECEFVPVQPKDCGEAVYEPIVGRGASYADVDGDGDLDVLFTSCGGPPRLLRNDQQLGNRWIRLRLIGRGLNRDAIGAQVTVETGKLRQTKMVAPTRSYLSQSELPLTFGLAEHPQIDRIWVRWPSGHTTELTDVESNQVLTLDEPATGEKQQ